MFDAYKVAVKITLINEVSKELGAMSLLFGKLSKDVDALNLKLIRLKKIGAVGGLMATAGFMGLSMFTKALKPAEDYAHQLNKMNMAGMKQKEIAEAVAAAWKTSHDVLTSNPTGNLKAFIDLRTVFGNTNMAIQYLPTMAKISAVLGASTDKHISSNSDELAFSLAKALDIRGAVKNPAEFNKEAQMMTQVMTAFQARVLPKDYQQFFKYARGATLGLSDQFLYKELPTFMLMMKGSGGGGSAGGMGAPVYALYRFLVQGVMSKTALAGMKSIGLVDQNAGLRTTTTGTMLKLGQHVKDVQLAAYDPYQYVQQVMLPAIEKKYGYNMTKSQLGIVISQVMKGASANAIFAVTQFAEKGYNVQRDEHLINLAKNGTTAFNMAMSSDPVTAMAAFTAQWNAFKTSLTLGVVPVLVPMLINLTSWLNNLAEWARKHPGLMKNLAFGFAGLSGALMVIGASILPAAVIGIYRLTAAITTLTATSNAAAAAMGGGAAAGSAAKLGTGAALAVGGGMAAGAGLFLYGGYKAYKQIKSINWHQMGQLFTQPTSAEYYLHQFAEQRQQSILKSELSNYGISLPATQGGNPAHIIIQIDGRSIAQAITPYLNQSLYHAQIQQTNSFLPAMTPTVVGTHSPY